MDFLLQQPKLNVRARNSQGKDAAAIARYHRKEALLASRPEILQPELAARAAMQQEQQQEAEEEEQGAPPAQEEDDDARV